MNILKSFLVVIWICSFYGCSESQSGDNVEISQGTFIEISPVNARITLEFSSNTQLVQSIENTGLNLTFTIRLLDNNQLELSCNQCDEQEPNIVFYNIINDDVLEIGGVFPAESTDIIRFHRII